MLYNISLTVYQGMPAYGVCTHYAKRLHGSLQEFLSSILLSTLLQVRSHQAANPRPRKSRGTFEGTE